MSLITNDAIMQHFGYPGAVNDKVRAFFNAMYAGSGSPEGVVTAATGAFYLDTMNGALYAKQSGSGNTGWIAGIAPGSGSGPYQRLSTFDVSNYGGIAGASVDNTAAVVAACAALTSAGGGTLHFGAGIWKFDNAVIGLTSSLGGVGVDIEGVGQRATFLKPNGTGQLLTIQGPGDSSSEGVTFRNLTFGEKNGDTALNFAYNKPLIRLDSITQFRFENVIGRLSGTGTLIKLDSCGNGSFEQVTLRTGRYAVPIEYDDAGSTTPQLDTVAFANVICVGTYGPIFRNIANGLDSLRLDGFKCVVPAGTDRDLHDESLLASASIVGDTVINVTPGEGVKFSVNSAIFLDYGAAAEINKVTAVNTDALTLAQPLRFAHDPSSGVHGQIIIGGVAGSIASNTFNVEFTGCHLEGQNVGWMFSSGQVVEFRDCLYTSRSLVRVCDALQDLVIGPTLCGGMIAVATNIVVEIPSTNVASISRFRLDGPFVKQSGASAITYLSDPGSRLTNVIYEYTDTVSGVTRRTFNFSATTQMVRRTQVAGVVRFEESADGSRDLYDASGNKVGGQYDWDSRGQAGLIAPSPTPLTYSTPTTLTLIAGTAYIGRFKTSRNYDITLAAYRLITNAGSNDGVEVAIYSSAWARLATTGVVTGKLNTGAPGIVTVPLVYSLVKNTVYYMAFAVPTIGGTSPAVLGIAGGNLLNAEFFGTAAGKIEWDSKTSAATPLPDPFVGGSGGTVCPIVALRES